MEEMYKSLAEYCRENIEDYDEKVSYALGQIDKWRAPLHMVDNSLFMEISDAIDDWCDENDYDVDEVGADIEVDELIFHY